MLGLLVAACSNPGAIDGLSVQKQAPVTPDEVVSSFSISDVNPLTGCGPRDIASAREAVTQSGLQVNLDVDGLVRGNLRNVELASPAVNHIQLPLAPYGYAPQRPGDPQPLGIPQPQGISDDVYQAPWVTMPIDYSSVEYWEKRSGLVDSRDEVARITDDLAEWASNLLSVMTINDRHWVEEAKYVKDQRELEERYSSYQKGLKALAERRKTISYAPAHTVVVPRSPSGVQFSSNEDLLYLTFTETEVDRFGNTLAASNVEGSTEFRIIAAEPIGSSDPTGFVRGGRLDFASNSSEARSHHLKLGFGEESGGSFLDKRQFTFGASIKFEPFPIVDPLTHLSDATKDVPGNEKLIRDIHRYYLDQNEILIGGRTSGWISVGLNLRCQIEITLNTHPIDAATDNHTTILVSERILNISNTSQILFSIDAEARAVTLTTGDDVREAMVTEIFDLPDDFQFSFDIIAALCQETRTCPGPGGVVDPDEIENFIEINSEDFQSPTITPIGLRGTLDWVYLANGVLAPQDATAHLSALDLQESVKADGGVGLAFTVSPAGHVVSVVLDSDKYEQFLNTDPALRTMLIVQEAIQTFGDNFNFVAVVPRETMSELAMGSDAARNYSVRQTSGTYNLSFKNPRECPLSWGNPSKLQAVLIGASPAFMTTQTFLHEIAHTWGNDVVYPSGTKQYLIDGHFGFSSANGYLGGFDPATLRSEGRDTFSAARFAPYAGLPPTYADIELYLMGLLPATEVEDIEIFVNVSDLSDRGNRTYFKAEGSEVITITDIERLAGKRTLEDDTEFEILYIVVSGAPLSEAQLAEYDDQAIVAARMFSTATRGLAALSLKSAGS